MEKRDLLEALDRMGCCNPIDLKARMEIAEPIVADFDALREERDDFRARLSHCVEGLEWIGQQPCTMDAEGADVDEDCSQTSACITEWCLPCYAKAWLGGSCHHVPESSADLKDV